MSRSLAISEKWIAKVWSNASLAEAWSTALWSWLWFVEIIWKLLEAKAILRLILLGLLLLFLQVVNKHFV